MTFEAGAITLVMLSAYGMSVSQLVADIILRLCSSTLGIRICTFRNNIMEVDITFSVVQ